MPLVEDASKYISRPKIDGKDGKLTEVYRVYYDRSCISFELFLWMEEATKSQYVAKGYKISKAYPTESLGPIVIYKN